MSDEKNIDNSIKMDDNTEVIISDEKISSVAPHNTGLSTNNTLDIPKPDEMCEKDDDER